MKALLGLAVSVLLSLLAGCTDTNESRAKPTAERLLAADTGAGRVVAERHCLTCHGLDGKGVAAGIPHLAAQREPYMLAAVKDYAQGRRTHAVLRDLMGHLSDADVRNIVAYYASLEPIANVPASDIGRSQYEQGRRHAAACAKCHGDDGNSTIPGTPTLAGQQPQYLAAAIQEYHQGSRAKGRARSMLRDSDRLELENLALYFASQTPVRRIAQPRGDSAAGALLSVKCGGCHGSHGVSTDTATPSLAGQDFAYLVKIIRSYRTSRRNWGMQRYVAGLGDRDIDNIAAYYASQTPKAADRVPSSTQEMVEKCDRCHDRNDNPGMVAPRLRSQDKDYLAMALRAYRDGRRESSTMHNLSFPYSNAIIDSLANWYAGQPAKPETPKP
jgi:cytochrome c553